MPRFYIVPGAGQKTEFELGEDESRHAVSVMRVKVGDPIRVADGHGREFEAEVTAVKKGRVAVRVRREAVKSEVTYRFAVAPAVLKPDRMELLIEKSCELGATAILPIVTERTIVRLDLKRWESKVDRWKRIAAEACKQCGLTTVPQIHEPQLFPTFVSSMRHHGRVLIPTLTGKGVGIVEALGQAPSDVLVLIGPEGDFTPREVEQAVERGAVPVRFGPLVLRSETATCYALSALQFFYREVKDA